jgi:hypothetical protein
MEHAEKNGLASFSLRAHAHVPVLTFPFFFLLFSLFVIVILDKPCDMRELELDPAQASCQVRRYCVDAECMGGFDQVGRAGKWEVYRATR